MILVQITRNLVLPPDIEDSANFQIYFIVHYAKVYAPNIMCLILQIFVNTKLFNRKFCKLLECRVKQFVTGLFVSINFISGMMYIAQFSTIQ